MGVKLKMKRLFLGILVMFLVLASGVSAFDLATVPVQTWNEVTWNEAHLWTLNLSTYVTGATGTITAVVKSQTGTGITITMSGSTATFTFADEDWTGSNDVVFTVIDTPLVGVATTKDTNVVKLIKNVPAYCDIKDGKKIEIGDIDFDDDKYKIENIVKVTVADVEAITEDLSDVEASVYLYNVDQKAEIDGWDIDEKFDIDKDDKEDFDLAEHYPWIYKTFKML